MKRTPLLVAVMTLVIIQSYAQSKIVLQNNRNPKRKVEIDPQNIYSVQTKDRIRYHEILRVTDSTVVVLGEPISHDTTYFNRTYNQATGVDSLVKVYEQHFSRDTIVIDLRDIRVIKKPWFQDPKWARPFGVAFYAAIYLLIQAPLHLDADADAWKGFFIIEGALFVVSIPPLLIASGNSKYNVDKNWTIRKD